MELLRFQSLLHTETGPTGRLRALRNGVSSFSSTDYLLAATIVVLDLYHGDRLQAGGRASGDTFAWGRERRDEMMAALQRSKDIWQEQRDQTMEAFKAAGTLEVMLARLNMGFTDSSSTAAPAFEPQDEKQNAAIPLGLLSSGMSPMNTAPPGFSDASVKMADAPLAAQGSFGVPADLGGAPSPFGSMFGQMPDMELNLDWVWPGFLPFCPDLS